MSLFARNISENYSARQEMTLANTTSIIWCFQTNLAFPADVALTLNGGSNVAKVFEHVKVSFKGTASTNNKQRGKSRLPISYLPTFEIRNQDIFTILAERAPKA